MPEHRKRRWGLRINMATGRQRGKLVRLSINLRPEIHRGLRDIATRENRSISNLIDTISERAIREWYGG